MSEGMQGKEKGDKRRQLPTRDCWSSCQGRGKDSMATIILRHPFFSVRPHRLWQAAREPRGPVRGGQPSDNFPPAWPLPCLTPYRRQSPHSKQPYRRRVHTAHLGGRPKTRGCSLRLMLLVRCETSVQLNTRYWGLRSLLELSWYKYDKWLS